MSCSHKLPRDKIGEYHEKKREMSRGHAVNSKLGPGGITEKGDRMVKTEVF